MKTGEEDKKRKIWGINLFSRKLFPMKIILDKETNEIVANPNKYIKAKGR